MKWTRKTEITLNDFLWSPKRENQSVFFDYYNDNLSQKRQNNPKEKEQNNFKVHTVVSMPQKQLINSVNYSK